MTAEIHGSWNIYKCKCTKLFSMQQKLQGGAFSCIKGELTQNTPQLTQYVLLIWQFHQQTNTASEQCAINCWWRQRRTPQNENATVKTQCYTSTGDGTNQLITALCDCVEYTQQWNKSTTINDSLLILKTWYIYNHDWTANCKHCISPASSFHSCRSTKTL